MPVIPVTSVIPVTPVTSVTSVIPITSVMLLTNQDITLSLNSLLYFDGFRGAFSLFQLQHSSHTSHIITAMHIRITPHISEWDKKVSAYGLKFTG